VSLAAERPPWWHHPLHFITHHHLFSFSSPNLAGPSNRSFLDFLGGVKKKQNKDII
jgi:hypothetical protein